MAQRKARNNWIFGAVLIAVLVFVALRLLAQPPGTTRTGIVRGAALAGFSFIFLATVSSAYMQRLVRTFGRPFVKVHHVMSITGLVLITIHPLALAWANGGLNLGVFRPLFDSWTIFWTFAGRPAWWLLLIATIAAVTRGALGKGWKALHALNYAALIMGAVHANLLSVTADILVVRIIIVAMAVIAVAVFVQRRLDDWRRAQRRRERQQS
jgi:DMSO/TMAO reductase YedYZ heme-binding membrane subunit